MAGNEGDSAIKAILVAVVIALLAGGSAPWWWGKLFPSPPTSSDNASKPSPTPSDNTSHESPTPSPKRSTHCAKPTAPILVDPGDNTVLPNHYYGQGEPWRFRWLDSSCEGGAIQGYRIVVRAEGAVVPAIDRLVKNTEYVGDVTGTISAANWSWKVRAVDDQNQLSDWSEERKFFVGPWKQ
jgi:hypothetical protein